MLIAPNKMFFLRREWQDSEDGTEAVALHWTATRLEQEPNWQRAHQVMTMIPQPATAPVRRRCTLWVTPPFPRRRWLVAEPGEEAARFLLHSFCEVVQRGRMWSTAATTQEIRALTVAHSDPSAECTQAFLYYSLDELAYVTRVPMFLEGLLGRYQLLPAFPEGEGNKEGARAHARRYKLVAQLPLPHLFRGRIWGPANTRALYAVYFSRQGGYNPFNEGGFWLLNAGGFWEVRL